MLESNDKKDNKSQKEQRKEDIKKEKEELEKRINDLLDGDETIKQLIEKIENDSQIDGDEKKPRQIKLLEIGGTFFKNIFLEFIFEFIISFLLLFAINYYFKIISCSLIELITFISIYFVIEYWCRFFIKKFWGMIVLFSLGLINFLITVIAFVIAGAVINSVYMVFFKNAGIISLVVVGYSVVRMLVMNYLMSFKRKNMIKKLRGK